MYVVSAFRRTVEVRLKPDTTYYTESKTAGSYRGERTDYEAALLWKI